MIVGAHDPKVDFGNDGWGLTPKAIVDPTLNEGLISMTTKFFLMEMHKH
jgi:hypothetical protein